VEENRRRGRDEPEFELIDTGVFDDDRYFDVFVEYAKAGPEDVLMLVTVHNRGREAADVHVLPQLWFRNVWSWSKDAIRPAIVRAGEGELAIEHGELGEYRAWVDSPDTLLFTDNDTNVRRLFGVADVAGHFKDAFHEFVVNGRRDAVRADGRGTKVAAAFKRTVPGGGQTQVRVRLARAEHAAPFRDFDEVMKRRRVEADEYYAALQTGIDDPDAQRVHRQALAGMIWNKQYYHFDVPIWLDGDPAQPPPPESRKHGRDCDWMHLNNAEVMSLPDKWEYPWYAAWDLAFHCIPLALVDPEFAKEQLILLCREWYMHPNGQLPAYEWAFGDVNPPVHAWAAWRVFQIDRKRRQDGGDIQFLERAFHKLLLNFTWWVNRKDALGLNLFQGGFLGMDNIGPFDRNTQLPAEVVLNQADGTAWMAMYCLNLMRIALELALHNRAYEDIATKFFEHFLSIAEAMTNGAGQGYGLWCEEDGFYYDVLRSTDGEMKPLRLRSMVGLIPLFAVETIEPETLKKLPDFAARMEWYLNYRPDLASLVSRWTEPGRGETRLLSLMRGHRMKLVLKRMLDERMFLSDYGVRSVSQHYRDEPYVYEAGGRRLVVQYQPGESESGLFGGNSNWRGPIWFPVNYLIIKSLQKFHYYYGDDFKVECPTGSGQMVTILDVADELTRRLARIFLRDSTGRRAVFGDHAKLQDDPHFKDHILFHEYFHGDNGRGCGAAHQTGWTGLIAKLLHPRIDPRNGGEKQLHAKEPAARRADAPVAR